MAEQVWTWEQAARRGSEMPDGLPPEEQAAYQAMRNLYAAYRTGRVSDLQAMKEKKKIAGAWRRAREQREFSNRMTAHTVNMWKKIEAAAADYRKNRTLETADRLFREIYGLLEEAE